MIPAVGAMSAVLDELQSLAGAATGPIPADLIADPTSSTNGASPTFSTALQNALGKVDDTISHANASAQAFSAGNQNIPLSDVMVSLEQANLALQMASGVRDKVVAAYTSIMNMQV
jgi:flagellar hook-basal body complex protein FliE